MSPSAADAPTRPGHQLFLVEGKSLGHDGPIFHRSSSVSVLPMRGLGEAEASGVG